MLMNNNYFKSSKIIFAINFHQKRFCMEKKKEFLDELFSLSNFLDTAILNKIFCDMLWLLLLFSNRELSFLNNRATVAHHSYSRWQHPGNVKTKTKNGFQIDLFQIPILSLEKRLHGFDCEHYVLCFKVIFSF